MGNDRNDRHLGRQENHDPDLVSAVNTPYLDKFIPANHLKKGERLQTPDGALATADGGTTPKVHDGWMWDLTVPGNNDHDFYVIPTGGSTGSSHYLVDETGVTPVLVHNVNSPTCGLNDPANPLSRIAMRVRMDHRVSPLQNVAVYRIGSGDGARYLAAASDSSVGLHSEEILNNYIDNAANGLSRKDVTGIYSERIPCASHSCMDSMSTFPNAQSDISFSLNPDESSKATMLQNARTIGRAMGDYQGAPAYYAWITP